MKRPFFGKYFIRMGISVSIETKPNIDEVRMLEFVRPWLLVQIPQREAMRAKHIWSVAICIFVFIFREICADLYLKTNQSSVSFQALQSFVAEPARWCRAAEHCKKFNQICQCFVIFIVLIATCCSLELWTCWCIAYDCKPGAKMLCK